MKPRVFFIDPRQLFNSEGPSIRIHGLESWQYYDKDGVGMDNYLQVLTSIGLYGFRYAVPISSGFKILDGNFRGYAAKELDVLLPVVIVNQNSENRHPFIYKWLWRFRKLIRSKHFLKRKWKNPAWKWGNKTIVMTTLYQNNIFGDPIHEN